MTQAINPLPSNPLESFTYDPVGNRIDSNQNGVSTFNGANQLETDSKFTYSYDNSGNLNQKTNPALISTLYEYDAENKLIRVSSIDKTVNYFYDGLGRRIEKEITDTGVTTAKRYIYDNEDILLELDGANNIAARYTHGPGIDEPLIVEKSGVSSFYHADGLGSVTELTDTIGSVVQSYTYSSFGKVESQLDPNFQQPYTYTSREFDPETSLYYYRARTYDPSIGRFIEEDPIRFNGGINCYVYVANNSVNLIDPLGLQWTFIGWRVKGCRNIVTPLCRVLLARCENDCTGEVREVSTFVQQCGLVSINCPQLEPAFLNPDPPGAIDSFMDLIEAIMRASEGTEADMFNRQLKENGQETCDKLD